MSRIVKKTLDEKLASKTILEKTKEHQSKIQVFNVKSMSSNKEPIDLTKLGITDQKAIIKVVVEGIYAEGTNNRAQKRGNSQRLIDTVLKNQMSNKPATVGIWSRLMESISPDDRKELGNNNIWDLITNSKGVGLSLPMQKMICRVLIRYANTATSKYYCYINADTLECLKNFIAGTGDESRNKKANILLSNALNFRTIFDIQERSKLSGGKCK